MKYKSVIVTKRGGPEALQVIEKDLREPAAGKVRIKVLSSCVTMPDVQARYGDSPFKLKIPFVPGYAVIGIVDAVGPDVTATVVGARVLAFMGYGGYTEYVYCDAEKIVPVPETVDPAEAIPLALNYLVAYQTLHRSAKVKPGDTVFINGASGGIGTAYLQLGKLAGLKMYGTASPGKHYILTKYGATPIDYHTQDFIEVIRAAEPDGLDAAFDGMCGPDFKRCFSTLGRGGTLVGYGNPLSFSGMLMLMGQLLAFNLLPNGKSAKLYGTNLSRFNREPFLEDWATLFQLLEARQIDPIIAARFPILEAAQANALLESGQVVGTIVLLAPELL